MQPIEGTPEPENVLNNDQEDAANTIGGEGAGGSQEDPNGTSSAEDGPPAEAEAAGDGSPAGAEVIPLAVAQGNLVWGPATSQTGGPSQARGSAQSAPTAVPSERIVIANELRQLADEIKPRDRHSAGILRLLADAVKNSRAEEARAYFAHLDPSAIAERMLRAGSIWGKLEVVRAALIFAPIGVTWFGLATAATAYTRFVGLGTPDAGRPLLYLWERGFPGVGVPLTFSWIAAIDSALIGLLILLSVAIHFGSDVKTPEREDEASYMASTIRGLLARAAGSSASDMPPAEADALLAEYVAEEKRIYDRALEREQHLFDLSAVVHDLRDGAAALENFGKSTSGSMNRIATSQDQLQARLDRMSERIGQLSTTISGLAKRIGDAAEGSGVIVGSASSALQAVAEGQKRILEQAEQLLKALSGVDKAQQKAAKATSTQTDSMNTAAGALDRAAQRVETAAKTLGTVSIPTAAPAVPAPSAPAAQIPSTRLVTTAIASAALVVGILFAGIFALDRLYETEAQGYVKGVRAQIVPLQTIQSLRVAVMSTPVTGDPSDIRAAVIDVLVAAPRVERWAAQRSAPTGVEDIASNVRLVAHASRRAAVGLARWLETSDPANMTVPPTSVLTDLALADELMRSLTMQLALASAGR